MTMTRRDLRLEKAKTARRLANRMGDGAGILGSPTQTTGTDLAQMRHTEAQDCTKVNGELPDKS
jgi:hypothetical protein